MLKKTFQVVLAVFIIVTLAPAEEKIPAAQIIYGFSGYYFANHYASGTIERFIVLKDKFETDWTAWDKSWSLSAQGTCRIRKETGYFMGEGVAIFASNTRVRVTLNGTFKTDGSGGIYICFFEHYDFPDDSGFWNNDRESLESWDTFKTMGNLPY